MAKLKTRFVCQECGAEQARWLGRCPDCGAWNALVEEAAPAAPAGGAKIAGAPKGAGLPRPAGTLTARPLRIGEVPLSDALRLPSGYGELDRVFGGGIVPGSLTLIGGEPGAGKSTVLTQVGQKLAESGLTVLYASGEESARQIRLRSERLGCTHPNLYVLAETDIRQIAAAALELRPDWLVVDSIQAVADPEASSLPGSVSQVRAATGLLMKLAKEEGIATALVGHVTKEGTLAGPRVLEHMVDVVLYFEGERFKNHRLIRAVKNRFGATHEVGIFEMAAAGLVEVTNPSALFLAERAADASGSAIVPTLSGTRPLLVEIQALVTASPLAQPRRAATGVENNRLVQILAVLEKRLGLGVSKADVYVNVAGGLDLGEPAGDLAVALAVASALRDVPLPPDLVAIGEVGLGGELRAVTALEARLKEAAHLGFKRAIVPSHGTAGVAVPPGLQLVTCGRLMEALVAAVGA